MMDEITPEQFIEWRAYSIMEPFEDVRSSYYLASITKALWDIARDTKKHPQPFELDKFLIQFGHNFAPLIVPGDGSSKLPVGPVGPAPVMTQTPEEKSRNLRIWAMAMAGGK